MGGKEAELSDVPLAHPDLTLRIGPDTARALTTRRRIDRCGDVLLQIDPGDVAIRERRVEHRAVGRGGDPVRTRAARRRHDLQRTALRIEVAEVAGLTGEPQDAGAIERRGVQVHVRTGKLEHAHVLRRRIDTHDRVQATVGDPWRAVGPDDHAVRRGSRAELHHACRAGLRIEVAELAGALRRVPDAAVGGGRDVVRALTAADRELDELHGGDVGRRCGRARGGRRRCRRCRRRCIGRKTRGRRRVGTRRTARGSEEREQDEEASRDHLSMDTVRRRSEFDTTVTDETAIAAAASTGESSQPVKG